MKKNEIGSNLFKYTNPNVIHRFVLNRFFDSVYSEINRIAPKDLLDFGCGEGLFLRAMKDRGLPSNYKITGIDIREEALAKARQLCPDVLFENRDLFNVDPQKRQFELVMAIEVLEHLDEPMRYLEHLVLLSRKYLLITVPHEPWFRLLNLLRGRYLAGFGNHPEHVKHWNVKSLGQFVDRCVVVERLYGAFPWVVLVGKVNETK